MEESKYDAISNVTTAALSVDSEGVRQCLDISGPSQMTESGLDTKMDQLVLWAHLCLGKQVSPQLLHPYLHLSVHIVRLHHNPPSPGGVGQGWVPQQFVDCFFVWLPQ